MASRLLPRGARDLLWQIALFCGAYWVYRLVRGQVFDQSAAAFEHAHQIVDAERALGLFFERDLQAWAIATGWLDDVGAWMYLNTHFVVTTCTLAFIYLFRNEHFYFVRNMFMVAMALALIGYVVYPTAPPRMLPELGFEDSVAEFTGVTSDAIGERALQPVRGRAVDARRLRADARGADDAHDAAERGSARCGRRTRRWSRSSSS